MLLLRVYLVTGPDTSMSVIPLHWCRLVSFWNATQVQREIKKSTYLEGPGGKICKVKCHSPWNIMQASLKWTPSSIK